MVGKNISGTKESEVETFENICPLCNGSGIKLINNRRFLCECQRVETRVIRRRFSGLPNFERYPARPITETYIREYDAIKRSGRSWLLYMGRSGSGKSTQAYLIVDALLNRPRSIYAKIFYYPDLVRELSAYRFDADRFEDHIQNVLSPELIVLDDWLDVIPKPESFEENIALMLIKRRYIQRKPLVITTEILPDRFQNAFPRHGEALLGRLFELCDGRLEIYDETSKNYRLEKFF